MFFSLEDASNAGTMTFRRALSKDAGLLRATCCRDAAAIVFTSFAPSCSTWD